MLERYTLDRRCKLNSHKTFRKPPGRPLHVLCTFKLRPVSTGDIKKTLPLGNCCGKKLFHFNCLIADQTGCKSNAFKTSKRRHFVASKSVLLYQSIWRINKLTNVPCSTLQWGFNSTKSWLLILAKPQKHLYSHDLCFHNKAAFTVNVLHICYSICFSCAGML